MSDKPQKPIKFDSSTPKVPMERMENMAKSIFDHADRKKGIK